MTSLTREQLLRVGELLTMQREVCEHLEQIDHWVLSEAWKVEHISDASFACGVLYFSAGKVLLVPPWDVLRVLLRHVRDGRETGTITPGGQAMSRHGDRAESSLRRTRPVTATGS